LFKGASKGSENMGSLGQLIMAAGLFFLAVPPLSAQEISGPESKPILIAAGPSATSNMDGGRWSWTSERLITNQDLQGMTRQDLELMRNEIYARHGWVFNRKDLRDYFGGQPWYRPKGDLSNQEQSNRLAQAELTPLEKKNLQTIVSWEKGILTAPGAPPHQMLTDPEVKQILAAAGYDGISGGCQDYFEWKFVKRVKNYALVKNWPKPEYQNRFEGSDIILKKSNGKWVMEDQGTCLLEWGEKIPEFKRHLIGGN